MSAATYKSIELVGTSDESYEDAIESAVARAGETMHDLRWFEVLEHRGHIEDGEVTEYQVKLEIWFHLED
jgi:flavin-binding protein dodecin